jgi:hypothetical protein
MPLETLGIHGQQGIYETEKLHNTLILADIFVSLQGILIRVAITSLNGQLSGPLLG